MEDLEKQIDAFDENEEYQKIIDLIESLDESEQTYDIMSELGRAYNNLANDIADVLDASEQEKYFYKAIEVFNSIKDDEKKDKKLHYRLAYTYHGIGKYFDALEELEKSLSIDSKYENSLELYPIVIEDLSFPMIRGYNLCERVEEFWEVFSEKESEIRAGIDSVSDDGGESISNFVDEILSIVFENPAFEVGFYTEKDSYEIVLPIDGEMFRIYSRQYLVSKMPESLKKKWVFTVGRRSITDIDKLALKRYEESIVAGSIKIIPSEGDDNKIDIKIYQPELAKLFQESEDHVYGIIFPLLDMAIGEVMTVRYIGNIDILTDDPDDEFKTFQKWITLAGLYDYIIKNLANVYEDVNSYSVYKIEPKEGANFNYREDIFIGSTGCMSIISAYYNDDIYIIKELYQSTGAILCYFYFSNDKYSNNEVLDIRANTEETIQNKASQFGVVIGGATGHSYSYIDFIAYDPKSFIEIGQKILETLDSDDIGFSVFHKEAIKYRL